MKNLLEKDFISHHKLKTSITVNVVSTNDIQFDLDDDVALVHPFGNGIAKYENPTRKDVNVINYESFFRSLPQSFQESKKNCDLIVYTADKHYFLLNELTETNKNRGAKERKAILQMLQVLKDLLAVPSIDVYIQQHKEKRCCFFNKKSIAPKHINAITSFNRQTALSQNGFKMYDKDINLLGFEFWEISGDQFVLLQ